MDPVCALLPCGTRLHLQHGPIDLIIGADGDRETAFQAATDRFGTILEELAAELPDLREALTRKTTVPIGRIAQRMHWAASPYAQRYVTRMAAVAGSVADEVLGYMTAAAHLRRAYVNNGGDIALHLADGQSYGAAISHASGAGLGQVRIRHCDPVRGIATSGRHGRSYSLGIADSVTILAKTAAEADVAATLIANAVDVPGHPAITRVAACALDDTSDLGDQMVVTQLGPLSERDVHTALTNGAARALGYTQQGLIVSASLHLNGQLRTVGAIKELEHA